MGTKYKIGQPLDLDDKEQFYRGTKYHFNAENKVWWRPSKEAAQGEVKATVKSPQSKILERLRKLRPEGGSFRVTEDNTVLTKMSKDNKNWYPVFVGILDNPFQFDQDINPIPNDLKPGDLWPSFYDGSKYSAVRTNELKVWFRQVPTESSDFDYPIRRYIEHNIPEDILKEFNYYKGNGGSFKVTENGHVITLITPQPLSDRLKKQWDKFSDIQQRLIEIKVEGTSMLPIYLGHWAAPSISLKPPKTYTAKLNRAEKDKMLSFLGQFDPSVSSSDVEEEEEDEIFWDDPDDFFGED